MIQNSRLFNTKNLYKIILALIFWVVLIGLARTELAHAVITLDPNPPAGSMEAGSRSYLEQCDTYGLSPAYVQWVSPSDNWAGTSKSVPAGTQSIALTFHDAGAVCSDRSAVSQYNMQITSAFVDNGATIAGLGGQSPGALSFNPINQVGRFSRGSIPFSISKPGGFTAGTYTISGTFKGINTRNTAPLYDCTVPVGAPGQTTTSPTNYGPCPATPFSFQLQVIITGAPSIVFDAVCSVASVTATTRTGSNYDVRLLRNGVNAGAPNDLKQNIPNGGNTTFDLSPWAGTASTYSVRVVDRSNGEDTTSRSVSVGPCGGGVVCPPGFVDDGNGNCIPPPAASCPSLPSSYIDVPLPYAGPNQGAPSGYSSYGATYQQYTPKSKTKWISNVDISSGGSPLAIPLVSERDGNATIDYAPYIDTYPYDVNQASVNYYSYYDDTTWTATGAPVYNNYYTYNGDTNGNGRADFPSEYTYRSDLLGYEWVQGGTVERSQANNTPGPVMQPCYNREFQFVSTDTMSISFDEDEEPSQFNYLANVTYNLRLKNPPGDKALRVPLQVAPINSTVNYRYVRADGSTRSTGNFSSSLSFASLFAPGNLSQNVNGSGPATVPPLAVGETVCFTVTVNPTTGDMNPQGNILSSSGSNTSPEQCSQPITNRPYVSFYESDISAGGGFGEGCTTTIGAINAFYRPSKQAGSSVQVAALALGAIDSLASAQLRLSPPLRTNGLSFASTTGAFGGSLGGTHCINDFYGRMPVDVAAAAGAWDLSVPTNGAYSRTSGLAINSPVSVPNGRRLTLYVDGDVNINEPITFGSTSWVSKADIPSLVIIARGNITIAPGVTQLDGVYVAQAGSPGSGQIITCAELSGVPVALAALYDTCTQPLTVNGAFIAQSVQLRRAGGSSLRYAQTLEHPSGAIHSCETGSRPVCAAEIFIFSPEVYLSKPFLPGLRDPKAGVYDSITSLPPIL